MKKLLIVLAIFRYCINGFSQNTSIVNTPNGTVISNNGGNDNPHSASLLDIRSANKGVLLPRMSTGNRDLISSPTAGLLLYNSSTNQFNYHDGNTWQAASLNNQWGVNGTKYYYNDGNVGIGTSDPQYKLEVNGSLQAASNVYVNGNIGIGYINNESIPFRLTIKDGSVGLFNSYDNKLWAMRYNSSVKYLYFEEDNSTRMVIKNGGNVGINTTSPTQKLDVNGNIYSRANISADGNAAIDGSMTVNNGKGVAYTTNGGSNLKIFRFTTANFHAILGPHASAETAVIFGGGFTSTPTVTVGDIDVTGGTVGELDRVILVLSRCSLNPSSGLTTCTAKIINTDNAAVDYNITWNCVAFGN